MRRVAAHCLIAILVAVVCVTGLGVDASNSKDRKQMQQAPERDPYITCLGEGSFQICCRNCSSCCSEKEKEHCNFGEGNVGWGNLGNDNSGDFNFANGTTGDCNMEDGSYGIGGPDYSGCPEELHDHIVGFCSIYPYYPKCHKPPHYYGAELIDMMLTEVLKCDDKIPVQRPTAERRSGNKRKRTRKSYMPRVQVATSQ